ncbi:MAG: ArsR/SmtB family transcription factor [Nocardioidaceae bacterium]
MTATVATRAHPGRADREGSASRGDADIAVVGALLGDASRCRILLALGDGRALPASRLAAEAGVSAATASSHLARLVAGGLLVVETHGRCRYYRLAGPLVGRLIELLSEIAPAQEIRSLRQSTRAQALRDARTCYDHLAGRLGVALMRAFLDRGYLTGGDGTFDPERARDDRRVGYGHDVDYHLTDTGRSFLDDFGVTLTTRRPVVRYCVDWSEQAHHLAGAAGRGLLDRLFELGLISRASQDRAVVVTATGNTGFADTFQVAARSLSGRWAVGAP